MRKGKKSSILNAVCETVRGLQKANVMKRSPTAGPLSDLLAHCDPDAPLPKDLESWERTAAVGRENINIRPSPLASNKLSRNKRID